MLGIALHQAKIEPEESGNTVLFHIAPGLSLCDLLEQDMLAPLLAKGLSMSRL